MLGENKIKIVGLTAIAVLIVFFAATHGVVSQQNTIGVDKELWSAPSGTAQASVANIAAPTSVQIQFLAELPAVSPKEQQRREETIGKTHLSVPPLSQENTPVGPSGGETNVTNIQSAHSTLTLIGNSAGGASPLSLESSSVEPSVRESVTNIQSALGTFTIFNNSALGTTIPSGFKSTTGEPSVGNSGNYVFYTGNWYDARSTDGGLTFSSVDPFADMPSFCCDQDVLYEQSRDIFIWYRQGVQDANGVNFFRLGISNDKGATWFFYNVYPTDVNSSWTNQWWDYPQLALSSNYLYIASNMFDSTSSFTQTVLLRFPLDALKNHTSFSFNYVFDSTHATFTPVQGATSTIYWGTHNSVSSFRLFSWNENSTSYNWYDRTIRTWTSTSRGFASCPGPDGYNWCAFTDDRVLSGWVANGTIGFFWNVMQGSGFPYPYVEAATFNESNKSYIGRPLIWNSNYSWMYAAVYPDSRGHLGISVSWGGGSYYPNHAVGIDDDFSVAPPPWEMVTTVYGTNGPSRNRWGDYLRVRPYYPSRQLWAATGYTLQGGSTDGFAYPRYIIFGRERDNPFNVTLSISASPTRVLVGIPTSVTFTVTSAGTAVSGATVTLSGNATGSNTTDTNGIAIISVNATGAGTIIAAANKTGFTSGSTTITANVKGSDTVGLYKSSTGAFYLKNSNNGGASDLAFQFGPGGWTPLAGDYDGNGNQTVGVYNSGTGTFYLKNSNSAGAADTVVQYGPGGSDFLPVVGDWDGDRTSTIGIYQVSTGTFYLRNSNSAGAADTVVQYGPGGSDFLPVVGDWNGDGTATIGLYKVSTGTFYLRNSNSAGAADIVVQYGPGGSDFLPVVGDWNSDGTDTIGIYRVSTGTFYLRNSNSAGAADIVVQYGAGGSDFLPLVGDWDGQ